ncbi:uncharacterized protein BO87DRAFT_412451 [Aspergillus neoniger CBS 115656]|uniref:Uncharacterized protein n=1 Tax=Aspergillus neoniger (strain CBS 115656) TaxID=1448310 RepID=A0A318ZSF1_ASPNB|nr:hypothetical protein BO87DRAFT_412451 [Aspergillus neoniger CBS 115656]PYH38622.1 hypothetical protein BO87DRAFT_412451 [Aspergillus neoniger CBS 115656]
MGLLQALQAGPCSPMGLQGGASHSAPHAQWPENHISGGSHGPSGYWKKPLNHTGNRDGSTPGSALLNLVVFVFWQRPELFCMRGASLRAELTCHADYDDPGLFALQRFQL